MQRERDRREVETRILLHTGNELTSAYNKTKRARRLMACRARFSADL